MQHYLSYPINYAQQSVYDVYIYNGLLERKFYINCIENEHIFDTHPAGNIENTIFLFPFKDKSIIFMLRKPYKQIIIAFIKNGYINYDIKESLLNISVLFDLIGKNDILMFLKKVNMFLDNTWQKYKKSLD